MEVNVVALGTGENTMIIIQQYQFWNGGSRV